MSIEALAVNRHRRDTDPDPEPDANPAVVGGAKLATTYLTKKDDPDFYRCDDPHATPPERVVCPKGVPVSTLFAKQASGENALSLDDVRQWAINDCYLMAPIGAMTLTAGGRKQLRDMIQENHDGNGNVVSYTVTFKDAHGDDKRVTVDPNLPTGASQASRPDGHLGVEIWPAIIEKAYVAVHGGHYSDIQWGPVGPAMEALTGRPAVTTAASTVSPLDVEAALAAGKPVVFATKKSPAGSSYVAPGLLGSHALTAVGVAMGGDPKEPGVRLRDPRGPDIPEIFVPLSKWKTAFAFVITG